MFTWSTGIESRRRRLRTTLAGALTVGLVTAGSGCAEPDPSVGPARESAVVEQVIRALLLDGEPVAPDEPLPLVYVTRSTAPIEAEVQAAVAARLVDEVTVRFADDALDAVDQGLDNQPVLGGGQLLVFDEIPARGRNMVITITRYLDIDQTDDVSVNLGWRSPDWVVQGVTVP